MDEENDLIAQRRSKMEALRSRKVEPFGAAFATSWFDRGGAREFQGGRDGAGGRPDHGTSGHG